ncbi:MAG: M23 family metallopeptidase [Rhodothermales bacterium]
MSLFVQLLLQLLLPAMLLIDLFKKDYKQRRDWIIDVSLVAVVLLFVFQTARWDWFSYYLRILLFPAFGLVAYVAFRCIDRKKKTEPAAIATKDYVGYGIKGAILVAMLVLNGSLFAGYFTPAGAVDLAYPLRGGIYYVGGGGANRWINGHNAHPPQDYALDVVRLNAFGKRATGLGPAELEKYAIYGDRVHSPCSGRVVVARDSLIDNIPPARDTTNLAGNHVVIACDGVEVLLAHLKEGSITVAPDDLIQEGFVLGQIGNSGNSSQPHLHIHTERGGADGVILDGEAVPMRFNGRFLVRNSLFSGRTNQEN